MRRGTLERLSALPRRGRPRRGRSKTKKLSLLNSLPSPLISKLAKRFATILCRQSRVEEKRREEERREEESFERLEGRED